LQTNVSAAQSRPNNITETKMTPRYPAPDHPTAKKEAFTEDGLPEKYPQHHKLSHQR